MTQGTATELDSLRGRLGSPQREFLNALWAFFRDHNRWVPARIVHQQFAQDAAQAHRTALGTSLVQAYREDGRECYRLTFLGVLLTDEGAAAEDLLVRYLEYVRDRHRADPRLEWVGSQEVETGLGLSTEQSRFLRQLIRLSHWWGGGSAFGVREWTVGLPVDVEELAAETDLRHYLQAHVLQHFPLGPAPIAPEKADARTGAFWFIQDAQRRDRLAADWREAQDVCHVLGWKSCVVLCGGILESLLTDALARAGAPPPRRPIRLGGLVAAAARRGVLTADGLHLNATLLNYRNLVGGEPRRRSAAPPDRTEAEAALAAVRSCLRQAAAITSTLPPP